MPHLRMVPLSSRWFLSAMAQDFYILLAKKSIFGNLLNVAKPHSAGPSGCLLVCDT